MDQKEISRILSAAGATGGAQMGGIAQILKQMEGLVDYLHHLESGMLTLSQEVQAQGLGIQTIMRLLIDKNVATEEEVKEYHKKYVFEPMKAAAIEMQQKMEQAAEVAKLHAEDKQRTPGTITANEVEATIEVPKAAESDVVLASESSKILRFPSDKQDS